MNKDVKKVSRWEVLKSMWISHVFILLPLTFGALLIYTLGESKLLLWIIWLYITILSLKSVWWNLGRNDE